MAHFAAKKFFSNRRVRLLLLTTSLTHLLTLSTVTAVVGGGQSQGKSRGR